MNIIFLSMIFSPFFGFGFQTAPTSSYQRYLDGKKEQQIWNMGLAFGELYGSNEWILHYDTTHNSKTSWQRSYRNVIKQTKDVGRYFVANHISFNSVQHQKLIPFNEYIHCLIQTIKIFLL